MLKLKDYALNFKTQGEKSQTFSLITNETLLQTKLVTQPLQCDMRAYV